MPQSVLMSLHMPAAAYARLKRKTARVGVLSITSGDAIGVGGELRVGASLKGLQFQRTRKTCAQNSRLQGMRGIS